MILQQTRLLSVHLLWILVFLTCLSFNRSDDGMRVIKGSNPDQRELCVSTDAIVRAKRKACLLRPDSGPCRADIIAWYYDAKQKRCYRFFWGGCQGNGNNFPTRQACLNYCYLSKGTGTLHTPHFCNLAFDFGTCFGQYNRWSWDKSKKICARRLYSGCGGNQNNFQTKRECMATCLLKPNNTMNREHFELTTCIPFTMDDLN